MSTTPTFVVYDELIATQQIKLKEAQKIVNDGFESAYATLREYQNKMAVVKVEEAEGNTKREKENKKREEGLNAWEAELEGRERELDERARKIQKREEELADVQAIIGESHSRSAERERRADLKPEAFFRQLFERQNKPWSCECSDTCEHQATDVEQEDEPPRDRVDSVTPADTPSQTKTSADKAPKLELDVENFDLTKVIVKENVPGITRATYADGTEEFFADGERLEPVDPEIEDKLDRLWARLRLQQHQLLHQKEGGQGRKG